MVRSARLLLGVAACLLPASSLQAASFLVTKLADTNDGVCDADCSLREAIAAANLNVGADDVDVPAGRYVLTLGELSVADDLTLQGAGSIDTVLDGNAAGRVLRIEPDVTALVDGLAVVNGNVVDEDGGGILNEGALTVTNARIFGNTSTGNGGGISSPFGATALSVSDTVVVGNTGAAGGGIYGLGFPGPVTLQRLEVSGNVATSFDGGGGVNVPFASSLTFTDSLVSGNRAPVGFGGGAVLCASSTLVDRLTVAQNEALDGGGIFSFGSFLDITNSTIRDNVATDAGGGLLINLLRLENSTVSGNTAVRGGGIAEEGTFSVQWVLTHVTIADNTSTGGVAGGLYAAPANVGGRILTPANTIVADNTPPNCQLEGQQVMVRSQGGNLSDDSTCGLSDPTDQVVADAKLGPLAFNGGATFTHALLPDSPAVDAALAANCPETDQRGLLRPFDGDLDGTAACDVGAYEFGAFGIPALPPGSWSLLVVVLAAAGVLRLRARRSRSSARRSVGPPTA